MRIHQVGQAADGFRRASEAFARAMVPAARRAVAAMEAFGEAWYRTAEAAYLHAHGGLPGSTRTARLRKKRRDFVLRWFSAEIRHV